MLVKSVQKHKKMKKIINTFREDKQMTTSATKIECEKCESNYTAWLNCAQHLHGHGNVALGIALDKIMTLLG